MSRRGTDLEIKRTLGELNPNSPDENFSKILTLLKQKTGSTPYDEKSFLDLFRTRINSQRQLQIGALTNYHRHGKERIAIEWMKRGGNISKPADLYILLTSPEGLGGVRVEDKALVFLEWLRKPQNSCDKIFFLTCLSKILPDINGQRKLALVLEWLEKNTSDLTRSDLAPNYDFTSNLNASEIAKIHFEWLQKRNKTDLFKLLESPEFNYFTAIKRAELFSEWLKIDGNNLSKDELYHILKDQLPANLKAALLETWIEKSENNLTKEELFDLKNNFLKDVVKSQREKTYLLWIQREGNNFSKEELFSFFENGGDLAKSMTPERLAIFLRWIEKVENNLSYDELTNLFTTGPLSHFKDIAEDLKYENQESDEEDDDDEKDKTAQAQESFDLEAFEYSLRTNLTLIWLAKEGNNLTKNELLTSLEKDGFLEHSLEKTTIVGLWAENPENSFTPEEMKRVIDSMKSTANAEEKCRVILGFSLKCEDEMQRREMFALATSENQAFVNSNNLDDVRARQVLVSDLLTYSQNHFEKLQILKEIILANFIHKDHDAQIVLTLTAQLTETFVELKTSQEAQQALHDFCEEIYPELSQNKIMLRNFIDREIEPARRVNPQNYSHPRSGRSSDGEEEEKEREVHF